MLLALGVFTAGCGSGRASVRQPVPPGPTARVIYRVRTRDRVVFVTMDDGFVQDPRVVRFVAENHWPISVFLIGSVARGAPRYFDALKAAGATIDDHTATHPHLVTLPYAAQRKQICGPVEEYSDLLHSRPLLFRPPWGQYDPATLRAAHSCGFTTVVKWSAKMYQGRFKVLDHGPLEPGEIILMHFRTYTYSDLKLLKRLLAQHHLRVARLEDYIHPAT